MNVESIPKMNLANKITIGRILIIPIFVLSFIYYDKREPLLRFLPLIIFIMATISDGVDGIIARAFSQRTKLGAILDPIADKLLLVTAFICLSRADNLDGCMAIPAWVPVIVISRDAVLVLGALLINFVKGGIDIKPSVLGKVTTFFQMLTVISILAQLAVSPVLWTVTIFLTVISGVDYVLLGSKMLNEGT